MRASALLKAERNDSRKLTNSCAMGSQAILVHIPFWIGWHIMLQTSLAQFWNVSSQDTMCFTGSDSIYMIEETWFISHNRWACVKLLHRSSG